MTLFFVILLVSIIILLEPPRLELMSDGVSAQLSSGRYTGGGGQMISPANAAWSNIDAYGGGSITQASQASQALQTRQQVNTQPIIQQQSLQHLQQQNLALKQALQQQQTHVQSTAVPIKRRWSLWNWLFGPF